MHVHRYGHTDVCTCETTDEKEVNYSLVIFSDVAFEDLLSDTYIVLKR